MYILYSFEALNRLKQIKIYDNMKIQSIAKNAD